MMTQSRQSYRRNHHRGTFHTIVVLAGLLFLSSIALHWAWSVVLVPHFGLPPLKFANIFALELALLAIVAVISKTAFLIGDRCSRHTVELADDMTG